MVFPAPIECFVVAAGQVQVLCPNHTRFRRKGIDLLRPPILGEPFFHVAHRDQQPSIQLASIRVVRVQPYRRKRPRGTVSRA